MDSEIHGMLRCSDCLLRLRSRAQQSKGLPYWAIFNGVVPPRPAKAVCRSHPMGPYNNCYGMKVGQSNSGCVEKDAYGKPFNFEELKKDYFMHGTKRDVAVDERRAVALDCEIGISSMGESELI
ncbi:hypothetical protein N7448_004541 [Penicillium atrosanguineum]|nr:hypothetical protein N7448_004541 [Penicillium atrosanguineum]